MTNDQIAELAKQAGFSFEEEAHGRGEEPFTIERSSINELKRFAELVRNDALEDAAKACDAKHAIRSADGFPREASTARALAKELRSMKA